MKTLFATALLVLSCIAVAAQSWTQQPNLPGTPRYGAASTQTSTHGYVFGGETADGRTNECWSFDPTGQSWSAIAPYPGELRSKTIAFQYDDIVYYGLGEYNGDSDSLLYAYDPSVDTWTEISGAPAGVNFWSASCFMIGSKAYIVTFSNHVVSYDCVTGAWEMLASFPGPARSTATAFSINGAGYFGLGYPDTPPFFNDFWKYDPIQDTWTEISGGFPGLPRYAAKGVASDSHGFIICGESQEEPVYNNDFWKFDPLTETFTQLNSFPANRNYVSGFYLNNQLYAGCGGPGWSTEWWSIDPLQATPFSCQPLSGSLADGLVGYWPFCGNANDESGNGNDGVVMNAQLSLDRFNQQNRSYHFDSFNDFIQVTNNESLSLDSSFSISLWFNAEATTSFNCFLSKSSCLNGDIPGYVCGLWDFDTAGENPKVNLHAYPYLNNAQASLPQTAETIELDIWYHFVVKYDKLNHTLSYYLNGELLDSLEIFFEIEQTDLDLIIGNHLDAFNGLCTSTFMIGRLDDIGIWNRALTPTEITSLYTGEPVVQPACAELDPALQNGLVGYWPFCGNANDESGNGNNGVVNGATLAEDRFGNAGGAYELNGSDEYISVSSDSIALLPSEEITLSVWFKIDADGAYSGNNLLGPLMRSRLYGYVAWYDTLSTSIQVITHHDNNGEIIGSDTRTPSGVNDNNWHLLTSTFNGAVSNLYLDGALVDSYDISGNLYYVPDGIVAFGRDGNNPSPLTAHYAGKLDDIGIWNRALTAEEVALLYGDFTQPVTGCTDNSACNFLASATQDDGSCLFEGSACDDGNALSINDTINASCGCEGLIVSEGTEHTCGSVFVHNPSISYGSVNDNEGNTYKTVSIGQQVWMAENLRTSTYNNGDEIAGDLYDDDWSTASVGAWTNYLIDPQYDCPYGKLYNWYTVSDPRGVCPTGWHIPTRDEWTELSNYLGGDSTSAGKMKSGGTPYWDAPNEGATNESGFSALPGGIRYFDGHYLSLNGIGFWWTSTEANSSWAYQRSMQHYNSSCVDAYDDKRMGYSIRCIQDSENTGLIPGCTDPSAFNYNPQANQNEGCLYTASVFVYNDLNGNGEHESNEPGLSNWPVVGNDINGLLWTNGNGNAFVAVPQGAYQFTVLNTTDNWVSTTPTSATLDLPAGPATASFGLQVIPGEAIVAAGPFTGFWDILHCTDGYESGVYLENIGSQTVSGFMTLTCDPLFTPNASSYFTTPPAETGPGYALWNIEDFLPGEYELLSYFVPGPGVEYLNAVFNFSLELTLLDPQGNIIYDETWDASPIVACAYDPNDLTGYPEGLDSPHDEGYTIEHFMRPDNMVEFRVRFQNTGTLPAEDIDIYIPINDSVWDLSTIEPLARAADMQVLCLHDDGSDLGFSLYDSLEHELPEGVSATDLLIFSFEDIFLPDSASDPDGSQGYVFFQMQAKHGLDVNTELNAQAFIYFEQNPPITTNETYHVIFDCESFTPMVGDTEICDGESLIFDATQPYVDAYEWQLNNVVIGSANTLQYPAEVGTYTLELNTKNVLCSLGENHEVMVIVHEIPELDLPLNATVCEGEELSYEAESNGSVTWSNGANTGDTFTADQSFTVTATALGEGNCSTSEDWMVTVNPLPNASVDSANFVLTAIDGVAWQWSVNGAVNATTQSITASVNGNYQVEITNEFGCVAISDVIEVELPIPDNVFVHSWSTLHLYPNPMSTGARLELPQGIFEIALYDITGACIRTLPQQQGTVVIERESLASGVYQLQVSQGEVVKSVRLIVE